MNRPIARAIAMTTALLSALRRRSGLCVATALAATLLVPGPLQAADAASATALAPSAPSATAAVPVPPPEPVKAAEPAKPAEAAAPAAEGEKAELVGASTCLACHAAKESFKGTLHAKAWPTAKGVAFEQSCETCHGAGSLHAAAAGDRSNPGFHTIKTGKAVGESCLTCHTNGPRIHWAGSTHEGRGVSCADCHDPHGTNPRLLKTAAEMDTCTRCHKDVKAAFARSNHHPVPEGKITCTDCHQPHGGPGVKLLKGTSVNETCFQCHAEKRGPFLWEHRPVTEDCSNCHTPHGSTHRKLLAQKTPFLCQECHTGSRHPGTIYTVDPRPYAVPQNQRLTGTTMQMIKVQGIYRNCLNCHQQVHGSNHPSGQRLIR